MRYLLTILLFIATEASAQIEMFHVHNQMPTDLILNRYPSGIAYGLKKLDKNFTGSLIRIRRSNDNSEQDIGFTASGELDTSSIISFVGSNSAFIVRLYNQGTLGNISSWYWAQSTNSLQPRIVNAGVIDRVNGQPAIYFSGSMRLIASPIFNNTRNDVYGVYSTSDLTYLHFYGSVIPYFMVAQSGSGSTGVDASSGTPSYYVNNVLQSSPTRNSLYLAHNGYKISLTENMAGASWAGVANFGTYASYEYTGYLQMLLVYSTDQSSNRSNIFSAINSIYSIY